ncbi:hypothetical protein [Haloarcula marina]|uniref:hypothetical protein n=1 Tax=Haloarcula marina TaxID=2961574 RepID=UPI003D68864D
MVKYGRNEVYPTLTEPAKEQLEDFYIEVRGLNDGEDSALPATPRTFEAGIRLSFALA